MVERNHNPEDSKVELEITLNDGTELATGLFLRDKFNDEEFSELYEPKEGNWFYSYQDGFVCKVIEENSVEIDATPRHINQTGNTIKLEIHDKPDEIEIWTVSEEWFEEYGEVNFSALIEK